MPLGWLLKSATGGVEFPLTRMVDATFASVAPLPPEKASTPFSPGLVEFTVMLVPDRVVIVADPPAVAKMPSEKLPPVKLIVPPLYFTVAVPLPPATASKPNPEFPNTPVRFPVALMMALPSGGVMPVPV
jgi:hypothetical protein